MRQRILVLSASMGAGHDAVADELAARLRARGHHVRIEDVLALLPSGVGPALRSAYRFTVRRVPGLYDAVYRTFLDPQPGTGAEDAGRPGDDGGEAPGGPKERAGSAPLAVLAERPLLRIAQAWQPDAVVSTFHLSAQVTGRLRERRRLRVPSVVCLIDFAVHRGWLHPANDMHLCVSEAAARVARSVTGAPAEATGPVVLERFGLRGGTRTGESEGAAGPGGREAPDGGNSAAAARPPVDAAPGSTGQTEVGRPLLPDFDGPTVLLAAGAWGVGGRLLDTARELTDAGALPVLLCGRDERLRRRAEQVPGVVPLGWVTDMPALFARADALVDNAAGQTAVQALAAGVPVIGYRPLPGHGAAGVRAMAAAGASELAAGPAQLRQALERVATAGPARERRVAGGLALFRADAAQRVTELALAGVRG